MRFSRLAMSSSVRVKSKIFALSWILSFLMDFGITMNPFCSPHRKRTCGVVLLCFSASATRAGCSNLIPRTSGAQACDGRIWIAVVDAMDEQMERVQSHVSYKSAPAMAPSSTSPSKYSEALATGIDTDLHDNALFGAKVDELLSPHEGMQIHLVDSDGHLQTSLVELLQVSDTEVGYACRTDDACVRGREKCTTPKRAVSIEGDRWGMPRRSAYWSVGSNKPSATASSMARHDSSRACWSGCGPWMR